jgi:ElaA protein
MKSIRWRWFAWHEWSNDVLYEALRLRSEIFVVEQNCVFLDMDGLDSRCEHLCGFDVKDRMVAYARLVPPHVKYSDPSIGRVVVAASMRGSGLGHDLMRQALAGCAERYPRAAIVIGAQQHLEGYYGQHGFAQVGESYMEDGIPHIDMRREPEAAAGLPG